MFSTSRDAKSPESTAPEPKKRPRERIQPFDGNRYRSQQFLPALMEAEIGIHEAYLLSGRRLTDPDVQRSLEKLVLEFGKVVPTPPASSAQHAAPTAYEAAEAAAPIIEQTPPKDFVADRIKSRWNDLFRQQTRHNNADLSGILRTIMKSVQNWSTGREDTRGYLAFLEKFMDQLGVSVDVGNSDGQLAIAC